MKRAKKQGQEGEVKRLPFEIAINLQTDEDKVIEFLIQHDTDVELSAAMKEKLKRYEACRDFFITFDSSWFAVEKKMREKFGISQKQAYRDMEATTRIYNVIARKQFLGRDFHISNLLSRVHKLHRKCKIAKDMTNAVRLIKEEKDILKEFYGGYEAGMYEDLQLPITRLGFFPEITGLKVPDNWEEKRDKLVAEQKRKSLFNNAEDAKEVE